MEDFIFDPHILILVLIMVVVGAFGGYLNHLHNFDTVTEDKSKVKAGSEKKEQNSSKRKYVLLGIGSALLVPVFLKMIDSQLIDQGSGKFSENNYLIFAGFCLAVAIFSRRFITTIGEKILKAAENAEKASKEAKEQVESEKQSLVSTNERLEDMKLSMNLRNVVKPKKVEDELLSQNNEAYVTNLVSIADSYIKNTSISGYSERVKMKSELGRKMGQLIVRYNLPKGKLFEDHPKEGIYLAIAYSVELDPQPNDVLILNEVAKACKQLYTKYVISIAYRTLAQMEYIDHGQIAEVNSILESLKIKADDPLRRNLNKTQQVLRLIDP